MVQLRGHSLGDACGKGSNLPLLYLLDYEVTYIDFRLSGDLRVFGEFFWGTSFPLNICSVF